GGRGSGKSHFFATRIVKETGKRKGTLVVCIREIQRTLKESAKRLIEMKLAEAGMGMAQGFRVYDDRISTPGGGQIIFLGMQDHTAESIKSLEGYRIAWVEEAQTLSQKSLDLLRPTIRTEGSEIWFSWNPTRRTDPVDAFFRGATPPTGAVVVKTSWHENPWWTKTLEQERLDCFNNQPDQYEHIYEGAYAQIATCAYYAASLTQRRGEGRIGRVPADPLMTFRACWDIGGTGAKADHTVIWVSQFVGREIRVLDYYEAQGQPLAVHLEWLRGRGYMPANSLMVL